MLTHAFPSNYLLSKNFFWIHKNSKKSFMSRKLKMRGAVRTGCPSRTCVCRGWHKPPEAPGESACLPGSSLPPVTRWHPCCFCWVPATHRRGGSGPLSAWLTLLCRLLQRAACCLSEAPCLGLQPPAAILAVLLATAAFHILSCEF